MKLDPFYPIFDSADWLERMLPLGVKLVQLRVKDRPEIKVAREIARAKTLCAAAGCVLVVNDYWKLAIAEGCEALEADPTCRVQSNRVFVTDGPVCSSAGVTTGIDLMLHRISGVCGPVVAAQVAQALVVGLRRGLHDPELSPFLRHRHHLHQVPTYY